MTVKSYKGRCNINLHCGDNKQAFESGKVWDLAIVDPPYGIGINGRVGGSVLASVKVYKNKGWDSKVPDKEYFNQVMRVSKNQIIWGANHFIENIPSANSSSWVVWDKQNGKNNFADCELAYTSFKNAVRMFTFRWAGMLQGNMKNKEARIHETQKPVALYKWLLQNYAKKGDTILDTHGGSMSIALAAWEMGFDLDLWELDEDYYHAGVERFERFQSQGLLF